MTTITTPSRAFDMTPVQAGIRAALLASSAVVALVGQRVYRDVDVSAVTSFPYVVITMPVALPMNTSTSTGISAIVDLTAVSQGEVTNLDALAYAMEVAVLDVPWTITGCDLLDVQVFRRLPSRTDTPNGVVYRYKGFSPQLRVRKH